MSAGDVYFPLKGLAKLYLRRKVNGVPTGPKIAVYAAQKFDVSSEQDVVEIPGNDIVCYEFANFKKFSIPVEFGAIRMDQLDFFLGGEFTDGETLAKFVEKVNFNPIPCEIWVETGVASDSDNNARYYEHYPDGKCLSFQNPRATGEAVTFSAEFSAYAQDGVKRTMFRDLTGEGIPGLVGGDSTPPTVTGSTPAHNATVTSAPTEVTVVFSEAMNEPSVKTIRLVSASTGLPVAGQVVTYEETSGPIYRAKIAVAALADGDYWVIIPATVKDSSFNQLGSQQVIKFTVDVP